MSSWLLLSDHRIQQYFLGLFALHMSLGCIRFLFPFQVLNLGGSSILISNASVFFSIGQIVGFILAPMIPSIRHRFFIGSTFLLLLMGLMSLSGDPSVLTIIRIFEGLGYGLLFLCTISIASEFHNKEGEVLGGLFAAIISGLAVGQGIAGILWNLVSEIGSFSSYQSIQTIASFTFLITVLSMVLILYSLNSSFKKQKIGWKWQHFHPKSWIQTLLYFPSIFLLLIVYSLYDFAHGLYTPNLSILLTQQGIDEISLSLGYLIGDITWGISQIFSGRLVDKSGFSAPLAFSLLLKGIVIIFYPEISLIVALITVLFLAGLAEGLLEPARNKAALTLEIDHKYNHSHIHMNLGFSASGHFVLEAHSHEHEHNFEPDSIIGALQAIAIVFFGAGSLFGSWLMLQGFTLKDITVIGGICLLLASLTSIFFSFLRKRSGY